MIHHIESDLDRVKDAAKSAEIFIEAVRAKYVDSTDLEGKRLMLQLLVLCYSIDELVEKVRTRCQETPPPPSKSMFGD